MNPRSSGSPVRCVAAAHAAFPGVDTYRLARDGDPETYKLRKGRVGNFREYLSADYVAFVEAAVAARGCEFTRLIEGV